MILVNLGLLEGFSVEALSGLVDGVDLGDLVAASESSDVAGGLGLEGRGKGYGLGHADHNALLESHVLGKDTLALLARGFLGKFGIATLGHLADVRGLLGFGGEVRSGLREVGALLGFVLFVFEVDGDGHGVSSIFLSVNLM